MADKTNQEFSTSFKPLHFGISVPDMEASIEWYSRVLGFSVESDMVVEPLKARIVFMKLGDFSVELFQVDDAKPMPEERRTPNLDIQTHGTKHVAFSVADIRAFADELKAKQVDFAMDVFPMADDLVCFIRDNSGILLEFIEPGGNAT